jgi:drug/metabolite transporter (DMT)-like permease
MTFLKRIPGPIYLWIAVMVFGAAASVVRVLSDLGAEHPIADGRNAISFCNLLFAGNACAAIALFAVHRKSWTRSNLQSLTKGAWAALIGLGLMANCVAPWLFFVGLEKTMVTSVVLVSQIEPPLVLVLAWLVFNERLGIVTIIGAALCLIGVGLAVLLQPNQGQHMIGQGEVFAGSAAMIYGCTSIFLRWRLKHVPLGIYSVTRNATGTVFFFIAASCLYSPEHFTDLGSPFLWKWMLVYGGIIIFGGQLAWDYGVRHSSGLDISLTTSFAPIAGVAAACFILGEVPTTAHYVGGAVMLAGIALCTFSARKTVQPKKSARLPSSEISSVAYNAECRAGFKGV